MSNKEPMGSLHDMTEPRLCDACVAFWARYTTVLPGGSVEIKTIGRLCSCGGRVEDNIERVVEYQRAERREAVTPAMPEPTLRDVMTPKGKATFCRVNERCTLASLRRRFPQWEWRAERHGFGWRYVGHTGRADEVKITAYSELPFGSDDAELAQTDYWVDTGKGVVRLNSWDGSAA